VDSVGAHIRYVPSIRKSPSPRHDRRDKMKTLFRARACRLLGPSRSSLRSNLPEEIRAIEPRQPRRSRFAHDERRTRTRRRPSPADRAARSSALLLRFAEILRRAPIQRTAARDAGPDARPRLDVSSCEIANERHTLDAVSPVRTRWLCNDDDTLCAAGHGKGLNMRKAGSSARSHGRG